jgi:TolB-like protein
VVALPDKPSIAVLPFQNIGGDPEQEYFVDGMVEEIITALSRIRWLFVVARNSSFTYKGQAVDVKQVGRELGVRYVLEGSVRKGGNRVRITAQLIDAVSGTHLWADRFDGVIEDVFELQDKVASSVAGVIEPTLQAAETARSAGRPTADLTAYDLYLRAHAMVWSSASQSPEALRLMEQAIARDPRYGPALAWASFCCQWLVVDGRSEDPEADRRKGIDFGRRALEVAGDDPAVLVNAVFALAWFGEDIGAMMALADRAVALNPNFARGWLLSGALRLWAGQPDLAIEHLEAARRLSPRARVGTSLHQIGTAHFFCRRFEQAVTQLLLAIQEDPSLTPPYRCLAACYAHMGRLDDARQIVARLRAITSLVIPDASYYRNAEHRELFLSGLRLAAVSLRREVDRYPRAWLKTGGRGDEQDLAAAARDPPLHWSAETGTLKAKRLIKRRERQTGVPHPIGNARYRVHYDSRGAKAEREPFSSDLCCASGCRGNFASPGIRRLSPRSLSPQRTAGDCNDCRRKSRRGGRGSRSRIAQPAKSNLYCSSLKLHF